MVNGVDCPFCLPRPDDSQFWIKVKALGVSTLYLDRNQTYRGHCLLVFDPRHVVGLESLTSAELSAFMADFGAAARAIATACKPDLMNYASLGNVIPHLHWHMVPRKKKRSALGRTRVHHDARRDAAYAASGNGVLRNSQHNPKGAAE